MADLAGPPLIYGLKLGFTCQAKVPGLLLVSGCQKGLL